MTGTSFLSFSPSLLLYFSSPLFWQHKIIFPIFDAQPLILYFVKTLFFFCTFGILTTAAQSQYILNTSTKEAQAIKDRILLLVLPEDDKYLVSRYQEEDSNYVALYKNDMEGQRKALARVVQEYWTFSDSIRIVSNKEAKSLQRKFPQEYAVMKIGEQLQDKVYLSHNTSEPPQVAWTKKGGTLEYDFQKRYHIKMLGITTLVIELPRKVIEVYLPKLSPSEGDYMYAVQQLNYILSTLLESEENSAHKLYRELNTVRGQLKDKVLLIDGYELGCEAKAISKAYPYPFKIVDQETIEKALKRRDSSCVVIQSSRVDTNQSTYYLSNAGNGRIYYNFAGFTFNYGEMNVYMVQVYYPRISIKHLQEYGKAK